MRNSLIKESIHKFYNNKNVIPREKITPRYDEKKLSDLIHKRTSFIDFTIGKPLKLSEILSLIQIGIDYTDLNLEYYIITNQIKEPDNLSDKLLLFKDDDFEKITDLYNKKSLYLQEEYSKSSVVILFVSDLNEEIVEKKFTYEQILQEVGTISQLMWIQAVNNSMYGSVFAGTLQKEFKKISDVDGINKHQIFAIALSKLPERR